MSRMIVIEGNFNDKDDVRVYFVKGEKGYSAYEIAVQNGYEGTEAEWKESFLNADNYYNKNQVDTKNNSQDQELLNEAIERGNADSDLQDQITINTNDITNIKAEQTTQNNLIAKKPYYFNSVAEMKAYNLAAGDMVITLGYYAANDFGGAKYKIYNDSGLISDDSFVITLNNGLKAVLIVNNEVNIKQLGAKEVNDIKPYIERYLAHNQGILSLFIPSGNWLCSELVINKWFNIKGENVYCGNTIINPLNSSQNYIIKLYNENDFVAHWKIENICFSTGSNKTVNTCLEINKFQYGEVNNINFQNVRGRAIVLKNCWEINFTNLIARHVAPAIIGENAGLIEFADTSLGSISTLYFNYVQLELIIGNVFVINESNGVYNNHIGTINIEQHNIRNNQYTDAMLPEVSFSQVTDEVNPSNHFALIKMLDNSAFGGISINTIDTNNLASAVYTINNTDYIMDTIIYKAGLEGTNKSLSAQIDMINFVGMKKNIQILNTRDGSPNIVNRNSKLIVNSINYSNTEKSAYFNCLKETGIKCLSGVANINNNDKFISQNLIFAGDIATNLETAYSKTWGFQRYDEDALSPNKLAFYPFNTIADGGYFKVIGVAHKLYIRAKSTKTTNLQIYDEDTETYYNVVINDTHGNYQWLSINLDDITDYIFGHTLRIGFTSGNGVYIDALYFAN